MKWVSDASELKFCSASVKRMRVLLVRLLAKAIVGNQMDSQFYVVEVAEQ